MRAIVPADAFFPVEVLDGGPSQPQVRLAELLLDTQQIQPGRRSGRGTEGATSGLGAKALLLQVEKTRSPLDVSQRFRDLHVGPFEHLTADQRPAKLPDQLLEVMRHHTVQVDHFTIVVIDYFHMTLLFHEEQCCATAERLDIAFVLRELRENVFCHAALAAHPRENRLRHK
ncbi:hypothetical protein D3C76_1269200 [compost metagenome]